MLRTKYSEVFPQNRLDSYGENDAPEFNISYSGKQIIPGSVMLVWDSAEHTESDGTGGRQALDPGKEIFMDPYAGDHAFFQRMQTDCVMQGNVESLNDYARLIAMKREAQNVLQNLGPMTDRSVERCVGDKYQLRGYMFGNAENNRLPGCIRPETWINKSDKPLDNRKFGDITIKIQMCPTSNLYYGPDATDAVDPQYALTNLRLVYRYYDLDDPRAVSPDERVTFERYHAARDTVETNDATVATSVPGLTSAVHMSFNNYSGLNTRTNNYFARKTLPGKPTLNGVFGGQLDGYGAERVNFAVNETDTAIFAYDLEFREEILWNYLRSFKEGPKDYALSAARLQDGEGYGIGTPWSALIDFRNKNFSCRIESEANQTSDNTKFTCFMYFPIVDVY